MRILFSAKTPVVATRKGSGARTLKWGLETGFLILPMEAWAASLPGESPGWPYSTSGDTVHADGRRGESVRTWQGSE